MRENNGTKILIEGQGDFKRVNFKNDDVQIEMTNLGYRILSLCTKDKDGRFENIILGLRNPEEDYHLMGISSDLQQIVIGAIIIGAVAVDVIRARADAKAKRLAVAKANQEAK